MALGKFLQNDDNFSLKYDKLLQLDLICKGVPSPGLFSAYIQMLQKRFGKQIAGFQFRRKEFGWAKSVPCTLIVFNDGTAELISNDKYTYMFSRFFFMRPSCYKCPFAGHERISDISIGDFWREREKPSDMFNDDKGVSIVLVNTDKGMSYFNKIAADSIKIKKIALSDWIRNPLRMGIHPTNHERKGFFVTYRKKGFEYCIKKYCYPGLYRRAIRKARRLFDKHIMKCPTI